MKDFVAIDFETANRERTSICSVGLVRVENGDIREKIYRCDWSSDVCSADRCKSVYILICRMAQTGKANTH